MCFSLGKFPFEGCKIKARDYLKRTAVQIVLSGCPALPSVDADGEAFFFYRFDRVFHWLICHLLSLFFGKSTCVTLTGLMKSVIGSFHFKALTFNARQCMEYPVCLNPRCESANVCIAGILNDPVVLFILLPNVNLALACFQPSQRERFIFQALFSFSSDAESCGIFFSSFKCAFSGYLSGLSFFLVR